MKFEWDPRKEKRNITKHGVTFEKACHVFSDPYALNMLDHDHSDQEERWLLLGRALNETLLVVVHTFKESDGTDLIRIISARKATVNERSKYQSRLPI